MLSPFRFVFTRLPLRQFSAAAHIDPAKLPSEKPNVFKKRPINIEYNQRDFATFYLPSEKAYFYSAFDPVKVFGHLHGQKDSPRIQKQIRLDSVLCIGFVLFNVFLIIIESKTMRETEAHGYRVIYGDLQKLEVKDLIQ